MAGSAGGTFNIATRNGPRKTRRPGTRPRVPSSLVLSAPPLALRHPRKRAAGKPGDRRPPVSAAHPPRDTPQSRGSARGEAPSWDAMEVEYSESKSERHAAPCGSMPCGCVGLRGSYRGGGKLCWLRNGRGVPVMCNTPRLVPRPRAPATFTPEPPRRARLPMEVDDECRDRVRRNGTPRRPKGTGRSVRGRLARLQGVGRGPQTASTAPPAFVRPCHSIHPPTHAPTHPRHARIHERSRRTRTSVPIRTARKRAGDRKWGRCRHT